MPLQGTDGELASNLNSDIIAKMQALTGREIRDDRFLQALCQAIAETVIAHLLQNVVLNVDPGIAVQVAFPAGTGATIAPGTGTIE